MLLSAASAARLTEGTRCAVVFIHAYGHADWGNIDEATVCSSELYVWNVGQEMAM